MNTQIRAVKKGFLWFKKVYFEVSYGNDLAVTEYCYSLGELVLKLINLDTKKNDIMKIISTYEHDYYKIK